MSKNLEVKKQVVTDLSAELKGTGADGVSPSTAVFNYSELTANDVNSLRTILIGINSNLKVVKNTLIKRTLKDLGVKEDIELEGQNAVLIPNKNDFVSPLKALFKFIKDNEKGAVSVGILNGSLISQDQVEALSKLPSREELLGQVVSGLASPIRGFMYVANGVQGKFVRTLAAIRDQQS